MNNSDQTTIDNKTIAKLAIAIATAQSLIDEEVIGPLTRKVFEKLKEVDEVWELHGY